MTNQPAAITIDIALGEQSHAINLSSDRPVLAANYFIGKSIDETLRLLPMLFSVCSKAQACASINAFEAALNKPSVVAVTQQRQILVNIETLREHLWRIFLQWPQLLGNKANQQALADVFQLQRELDSQLNPGNQLFSFAAQAKRDIDTRAINALTTLVDKLVFGGRCEQWLAVSNLDSLEDWIASTRTPARDMMALINSNDWQAAGDGGYQPLPLFSGQHLSALRQQMDDDGFIAQPTWDNHCCESTPLTRNNSELISASRQRYGTGLLTRAIALLTEVAQLAVDLKHWFAQGHHSEQKATTASPGLAVVQAARGQLFHSINCQNESVSNYRILAPTEWNFHPLGVVKTALGQLQGDANSIKLQAHLFIELLDPCVGYHINVHQGAPANA